MQIRYSVGEHLQSGLRADFASVRAWKLPDDNLYISVPLEGDEVWFAAAGALISRSGNLLERAEISICGDKEKGRLRSWSDGKEVLDTRLENPDETMARPAFSWNKFNSCLSAAGVPAWAVTAISISCTAACVGIAVIGCIVCASAAAAVAGGTIGYCVDKAS